MFIAQEGESSADARFEETTCEVSNATADESGIKFSLKA